MKKYILLLLLAISFSGLFAQSENFKIEVSGGAGILSRGNGSKSASFPFISVDLAYYYNGSYGFSSGVTRIYNFDRVDGVWEIPLFFTHRSGVTTRKNKVSMRGQSYSAEDAAWGFFSYLLPTRFDWSIGPTLGYYQGGRYMHSEYGDEGFEVKNRFGLSLDAEFRFYYVFGKVKLSISPVIGYLFTSNVTYASGNGHNLWEGNSYEGMIPHIRFRIKAGLAFSF